MKLEIERKFRMPDDWEKHIQAWGIEMQQEVVIDQTYLALTPDEEIRVRKITGPPGGEAVYTHTFKRGNGLKREETEYTISAELYGQLVDRGKLKPLVKRRFTAYWEGVMLEIDAYDQFALHVVEVEFDNEEEAIAFHPPSWFGEELDRAFEYSNKSLWKKVQSL